MWILFVAFFFFKQKTAYEMRISDWSSDVCSSDLLPLALLQFALASASWLSIASILYLLMPDGARYLTVASVLLLSVLANLVIRIPANQIGRASCRERVCQYV